MLAEHSLLAALGFPEAGPEGPSSHPSPYAVVHLAPAVARREPQGAGQPVPRAHPAYREAVGPPSAQSPQAVRPQGGQVVVQMDAQEAASASLLAEHSGPEPPSLEWQKSFCATPPSALAAVSPASSRTSPQAAAAGRREAGSVPSHASA